MSRTVHLSRFSDYLPNSRWFSGLSRTPQVVYLGVAVIGFLFLNGCDSQTSISDNSSDPSAETQTTPSVKKSQTTSVTPSKSDVETSPAAASNELPPVDSTPAEVCQRFMELLKSGNRTSAENLLTRTALTATTKAGLQLEPMGGPTARYEIGQTRFATTKNELAQVECGIVEQIDGQEIRSDVTWQVRKQSRGWRVSGLVVQFAEGQAKDLLSFENLQDVEKIKSLASGEVAEDPETRQAAAPSEASNLK